MNRRQRILMAVTVSLTFLLAGNRAVAQQIIGDSAITLAVEAELINDPSVPAPEIGVSTLGGTVTLSGAVDSYAAKLRAGKVAQAIKGVVEVRNEIRVDPVNRTDAEITNDVVTALAVDPATEPYEIQITVDDGIVTLKGEADSFTERKLAEELAQTVRGVKHVENLLTYEVQFDRPNHEIDGDIEGRLRANSALNSGSIQVSVNDGDVVLEGAVASALEKALAESEAKAVMGVKSVENNLAVKWWLLDEVDDWGQAWTDRSMRQAIKNRLLYNPRVKTHNVIVDVTDGVATLTGTVDNLAASHAAQREAEGTLGIWNVNNYLRVRPKKETSDADVAGSVKAALHRNPYVDRYDISVQVRNGLVYLKGEVDSMYMKEQAEEVVSSVPGVVDIHCDLKVDTKYASKSDPAIKEDIESQLWWSPFVDSDDITVEVHGGVATLHGQVQDWSELLSAKENAIEGGATSVISDLAIRNGKAGN